MAEGNFVIWSMRIMFFAIVIFFGAAMLRIGLQTHVDTYDVSGQQVLQSLSHQVFVDGQYAGERFDEEYLLELYGESNSWGMRLEVDDEVIYFNEEFYQTRKGVAGLGDYHLLEGRMPIEKEGSVIPLQYSMVVFDP